jgi:hypothetical protein
LRHGSDWLRLAVNDHDDRKRLLAAIDQTLDRKPTPRQPTSGPRPDLVP